MNKLAVLVIAAVVSAPAVAGADSEPATPAAAVTQAPKPAEPTATLAAAAPGTKPAAAPTTHSEPASAVAKHDAPAPAATHGAAPADSASSPLADLRLAYQNAWAQRQSGDYELAAQTAARALERVDQALAAGPDQSSRGDLTELRSRLSGLQAAALKDHDAAIAAKKSGNVADEKVLNAPATDNTIEPQVNDQVVKWIEFFTGSGRSTFERWLKRSGRYMELFRQALHKEGLPPDLVHLVFVESGFNLNARSVSAAVGPWQFLSGTAKLFGLTVNRWVDERRDPEKSTVAAARYLKHLYTIFGDWPLALASYNAGEGTVLRAIRAQGTTNYWDLKLPRQTEDYVPQFMAILAISRDPSKYGFDDVELDEPMAFDEVALRGAVDLRALARLADCPYEEIKLLNPAVLGRASKGRDGVTTLRVPRGKGEILMQRLQHGETLPAVDLTLRHRVRRGETLRSIAAQYGANAHQLALRNGIGRRRPLRRGMTLVVPASLAATPPALLSKDDPRAATDYVPARNITPRRQVDGRSTATGRVIHTVRRGETLASIAARYNVSTDDLMRWNRLRSGRVRRGTRLKLRLPASESATQTKAQADVPGPPGVAKPAVTVASDGNAGSAPGTSVAAATAVSSGGADSTTRIATAVGNAEGSTRATEPSVRARSRHASRHHGRVHAAMATRTIIVRRGTTLATIAARHHVSVTELMRVNGLTSTSVKVGQRLKLPVG